MQLDEGMELSIEEMQTRKVIHQTIQKLQNPIQIHLTLFRFFE